MISPTGKGIRIKDDWGEGHYGASRGTRKHDGTDYICEPGQKVVSPIKGKIVREAKPYARSQYSGVLIQGDHAVVKMFYFSPFNDIIGKTVEKGTPIGVAQDIGIKYPGIIPHLHVQVVSVDPEIFIEYL